MDQAPGSVPPAPICMGPEVLGIRLLAHNALNALILALAFTSRAAPVSVLAPVLVFLFSFFLILSLSA